MSSINGDKARFHKKRKDGIARRARNRARLNVLGAPVKPESPAAGSGKKGVAA